MLAGSQYTRDVRPRSGRKRCPSAASGALYARRGEARKLCKNRLWYCFASRETPFVATRKSPVLFLLPFTGGLFVDKQIIQRNAFIASVPE